MLTRLFSRYWLLLPLLIIVVIAVDRIEAPTTEELEETINMHETQSDYYMAEFHMQKFSETGNIEYTIEGDTLAHFPDTDQSEIVTPRIQLHRTDTIWNIRSQSGQFSPNPDTFMLLGEVIIERQHLDVEPITITTNQLKIATASNTVTTDHPIKIAADSWTLNATGMTSAIDDGKLTLQSDVTGRFYAPRN